MTTRRGFLKTAAIAALSTSVIGKALALSNEHPNLFNVGHLGEKPKMKLTFFPYELQLRHVFTVATYSRSTTPDVQVELTYDGITGYGEASMPPYLANELGTIDSVCAFLARAAIELENSMIHLC